jgi:heme-degrading monooxygenase HmoA
MFIAMNRVKVIKGSEAAFESVWLSRDSHLDKVPGFVEFHLLKGPEAEDHTLYASHTVWKDRATFEAWTKFEAFRAAHAAPSDLARQVMWSYTFYRPPCKIALRSSLAVDLPDV